MYSETRRHSSPARRAGTTCLRLVLLLTLGLGAVACGNKRPPKAPPRMVPATTNDLTVTQRGTELQFAFTYPAVTIGGLPLPGLEAVELWRMTRPLVPPPPEEEGEEAESATDEVEEPDVEEAEAAAPEGEPQPTSPFLFRRPTVEEEIKPEDRIEIDPRELLSMGALELRIEGAELQAAIAGDRVLLRLPLREPPPPDVPEEEREIEAFAVITVSAPKGLPSQVSNPVKIMPRTPPAPPSQIETRPGADGINVVWRADDPAVGFRVYRRDAASRVYPVPIAEPEPEARSHLDQTAVYGSRYVYSVTSVALDDPLVESALGAEREVQYEDRYPPEPPTGLIVLAEPGRARVLWEPATASDLAGYLVYRRGSEDEGFDRMTAEPGLDLEYLDETVASGRGYSYYVSAVDSSGNESEASETVDVEVP